MRDNNSTNISIFPEIPTRIENELGNFLDEISRKDKHEKFLKEAAENEEFEKLRRIPFSLEGF